MPIIAESPPIIFGAEDGSPAPTPSPTQSPTPFPEPTPGQEDRWTPTPYPEQGSSFVARHTEFIDNVDRVGACFKRADLPQFTDQEFTDHSDVAIKDRYLAKNGDTYCSMQGVSSLAGALKRAGEQLLL